MRLVAHLILSDCGWIAVNGGVMGGLTVCNARTRDEVDCARHGTQVGKSLVDQLSLAAFERNIVVSVPPSVGRGKTGIIAESWTTVELKKRRDMYRTVPKPLCLSSCLGLVLLECPQFTI